MSNGNNWFSKLIVFSSGLYFGVACGVAAADLTIPDVPLQTGSDVPVNLMFVLDDSGSMARSYLPDGIKGVCADGSDTSKRALGRSPDYNKAYFNPAETYVVPPQANGNPFSTPTFTSAWKDGYAKSGSVNLKTSFRATWENSSDYCGSSGEADYYLYDKTQCTSNDPEDYRCYKRYKVADQSTTIQNNFAIWYSYYRDRKMAARAGIGRAFSTLPESMRVGYGAINNNPVKRGVLAFAGTPRSNFFTWLYGEGASGSTPLRGALKKVGDYYKTDEPYLTVPTDDNSGLVSCRQNFAILMSDGGWNESTSPGVGNSDGDGYSNTLADVAYEYWKKDLRADLKDNVPTPTASDADWQHMVTYTVGLGVEGDLVYNTVKNWEPNASGWTNPGCSTCADDPGKVDDFIHAAVNGKGGFFSAKSPTEFATELTDTLKNLQLRTASATNLSATTTSLQEDNSVFQASFNTKSWTGDLVSRDVDDLTKVQWSANFPVWNTRKIYTSRNNTMIPFAWAQLNGSEQTVLGSADVVDYLRGNRSKEKTTANPAGIFRERVSLLGDIAHSSPLYVAAPQNRNYQRYNWTGASSYVKFLSDHKNRAPVIYIGANDGMLHGFNADAGSATKGQETFAYVPRKFVSSGSKLATFASLDYEHKFFVDGSPTVNDVYINGAWRSVLITTLGRGGNSIIALDVTNPADVKLLWDLTVPEIGLVTSKPVITRLNGDRWAAVLPYGYNNSTGKNGLLVIDIEKAASEPVVKIETPASSNGLGQIEGWDANGNGNTDWFFAGDLNGNIWKFDLSGASTSSWKVDYGNTPLFIAKDKSGKAQPITGGLTLSSHPETAQLWVFFGTGKFLESGDSINSDTQSWYGITDGSLIGSRSQLVDRTMTNVSYTNPDTGEVREGRSVPIAGVNDLNGKRGWVMDLVDDRERITSKPRLVGSNLVMNTIIPDVDLCNPLGDGWIMAIDPFSGGRLKYHFFDLSRDDKFEDSDALPENVAASGVKFQGMPGEPVFVGDEMLVGDSRVAIDKGRVNLQIKRGRLSWREVINQ
ncbi:PilC/PilY family type IV pilus protein [Rheinheimera aquimaris]|uniref:PilC/PilY family type IV pilus protein n=1 Tax=Rheinheimera aquimaris TaxID=412437 RepID=A0ABP3P3K1_9GAMM|nr:PilC/PilY family type IV pilus protein [Rheinheimera aquimaris]MCB5214569.1 pilus assembly protein PilY [Rheinheimera aquimaris]